MTQSVRSIFNFLVVLHPPFSRKGCCFLCSQVREIYPIKAPAFWALAGNMDGRGFICQRLTLLTPWAKYLNAVFLLIHSFHPQISKKYQNILTPAQKPPLVLILEISNSCNAFSDSTKPPPLFSTLRKRMVMPPSTTILTVTLWSKQESKILRTFVPLLRQLYSCLNILSTI